MSDKQQDKIEKDIEKDIEKNLENYCKGHHKKHYHYSNTSGGDMVYCLGMIGAAVYFISHAVGFWAVVVAILKAIVWPAFFTYEIFQFLIK